MKSRKKLFAYLLIFSMLAGMISAGSPAYAAEEALLIEDDDAEFENAGEIQNAENELPDSTEATLPADSIEYVLEDGITAEEYTGSFGDELWDGEADEDTHSQEDPLTAPAPSDSVLSDENESLLISGTDDEPPFGTDEEPPVVSETVTATGTIYASKLADNTELVLKGKTTLVMDTARTLKSISGSFALVIEGNNKLAVKNTNGHAIAVKSVTCSAPLSITASKDGLNADQDINLSGVLSVSSGVDGVYSRSGSVTILRDAAIAAGDNAIETPNGDISVVASLTAVSESSKKACLQAGHAENMGFNTGSIALTGERINISSEGDGIYIPCGDLNISGNCTVTSSRGIAIRVSYIDATGIGGGIYGEGNVWINGTLKAQGKTFGISSAGAITISGGPLAASGSEHAIYAYSGNIDIKYPLSIIKPVSGKVKGKTIVDSGNTTATYVEIANIVLSQIGTVVLTSGAVVGQTVSIGYTGELLTIRNNSPQKMHYQWQISNDGNSGWSKIDGAANPTYKPVTADVGKYIRIAVTADGYTGAAYSQPKQVTKMTVTGDPVSPVLSTEDPYTTVTVTNAKKLQEYVLTYSLGNPDWSKAKTPASDGTMALSAEKGKTAYIYTRTRETATAKAGTKVVYSKIYNGYVSYLVDLTLNKSTVTTRVGEVTALSVIPLPVSFHGWMEYTVSWFVNGYGVSLYADEACSITLSLHTPIKNKTVYVKGTSPVSYVQVGVEKQVGYTDLRTAFCTFEVADANGNFVLSQLNFEDAFLEPGKTVTVSYTTTPSPARLGALSFIKTQGPSDLKLTADGSGTVTISAPANAATGTYYYEARVNGASTPYKSAIKITVANNHEDVCPSILFNDIPPLGSAWYHEDVDYVVGRGYMTGVSISSFAPNKTLTRAMVVTILYRMAGQPSVSGTSGFSDVPSGKWYSSAVTWAKNKGIATGYSSKIFGPEDPVTREQMVTFLYRYAGSPPAAGSLSSFPDAGKVGSWAVTAMKWAIGRGIIKGNSDGTLNPGGTATRAQFAAIVHRYHS